MLAIDYPERYILHFHFTTNESRFPRFASPPTPKPNMIRHLTSCLLGLLVMTSPASAQTPAPKDRAPDLFKSAFQKYSKNDLNGASEDLAAIQAIIDDRRGNFGLRQLPDIKDWQSKKAEKGAGLLGSGSTLRRVYTSRGKTVTAEIIMDSPIIQQLAPLLTTPEIAAGAGFETRRITGKEALIKAGDPIELNLWIGAGILFKLTGTPNMKENEIVAFAKHFDFDAIEKLKKDVAPEAPK